MIRSCDARRLDPWRFLRRGYNPADGSALPANTPSAVVRLLRRALHKDRSRRLADIADARLELLEAPDEPAARMAIAAPPRQWRERLAWMAAVVALGAIALWAWSRSDAVSPAAEMRVDIATPPTFDPMSMAISPDGRKVVFAATVDRRTRLWLRNLESTTAEALAGTDNARFPFWSPDSRSIGFSAEAQLKRLDLDGGAVRGIAHAPVFLDGAWSASGDILFIPEANSPVFRVSHPVENPRR